MSQVNEDAVKAALQQVKEPELGKDIVSLRMVKSISVSGTTVTVGIELYTPAYAHRAALEQAVQEAVTKLPGVEHVELQFSHRTEGRGARTADQNRLPGVKNIIAVAAGKGGVGKSTVATNLALALRSHGATVGLLDADVYGPSVPTMLGDPDVPAAQQSGQKIIPAIHWGIKVMSIGFFVEREGAVVWRGPMVHKLLQQFLEDVDWGQLDYMVVDLPPGTGDAQLSLSQLIPITGAVMVTTPQEVALIDVVKAVSMFKKVEIPILGVIENMSYYVCPACGHNDEIFSRGGGRRLADQLGTPFLGELPLDTRVRYGGDTGRPVVVGAPETPNAKQFMDIAARVATRIGGMILSGPRRPAGLVQIR
ncbi:MAG TPA: iron-sulfur cluster carrier protein ApbC [Polyangia bacterium]|jgi:ATP-binding protein involved in chromosome partitioning|nr:iron-sulfur cluster carrier protein ApbC [Polyangia bacterium]